MIRMALRDFRIAHESELRRIIAEIEAEAADLRRSSSTVSAGEAVAQVAAEGEWPRSPGEFPYGLSLDSDQSPRLIRGELTDREREICRDIPAERIGLSVRGLRAASALGLETALDVACCKMERVIRLKNAGRATALHMREAVALAISHEEMPNPTAKSAKELMTEVNQALMTLPKRDRFVVEQRLGLWDGLGETLEEIGEILGLTRERVRQIQKKSIRLLRTSPWSRRGTILLGALIQALLDPDVVREFSGVHHRGGLPRADVRRSASVESPVAR